MLSLFLLTKYIELSLKRKEGQIMMDLGETPKLGASMLEARIAVLTQLLHILQTQRITDRGFLMMNIAKSLLIITVINHFTACIWYAIATFIEDDQNWVYVHSLDPRRPDSLIYIYTTAA